MSQFDVRLSSLLPGWCSLASVLALSACGADPGTDSPADSQNFAQPTIANVLDPTGDLVRGYTTYIALGDSYSSANGVANDGPVCMGGEGAWPYLLQEQLPLRDPAKSLVFAACSGATTQGILGAEQGMAPQIDSLKSLAPADLASALITITIGGNDIDVALELAYCLATDCTPNEMRILNNIAATRAKLDATFKALRAAAPTATIVAVGYPHLVAATAAIPCNDGIEDLDLAERTMIRGAIDAMNANIAAAAKDAKISWVVDQVVAAFEGREACSGSDDFIHRSTPVTPFGALFHPNAAGNGAYAAAVLKGLPAEPPSAPAVTRPIAASTPAATPGVTPGPVTAASTTPMSAATPARSTTPTPAQASSATPKPTATSKPSGSAAAPPRSDATMDAESDSEADSDEDAGDAQGREDEGDETSGAEGDEQGSDGSVDEGDGQGVAEPGADDGTEGDDGWDLGGAGVEDDGWDLDYDG